MAGAQVCHRQAPRQNLPHCGDDARANDKVAISYELVTIDSATTKLFPPEATFKDNDWNSRGRRPFARRCWITRLEITFSIRS
jgi:hypothetical protein